MSAASEELAVLEARPLPGGHGSIARHLERIAYLKKEVLREEGFGPIMIDTIMGPRELWAPVGWKYDKTARIAWSKLLQCTRDRRGKLKTKRDGFVLDGQIEALANVLANSLGMAGYYWESSAAKVVDHE